MEEKSRRLSIESALYALLLACQRRFDLERVEAFENLVVDLYEELGGRFSVRVSELLAEAEEEATPGRILNAPVPVVDRALASDVAARYASQLYDRIAEPDVDDNDLDEVYDKDEWMQWFLEETGSDQSRDYERLHSREWEEILRAC